MCRKPCQVIRGRPRRRTARCQATLNRFGDCGAPSPVGNTRASSGERLAVRGYRSSWAADLVHPAPKEAEARAGARRRLVPTYLQRYEGRSRGRPFFIPGSELSGVVAVPLDEASNDPLGPGSPGLFYAEWL
jgi:hypothetical protein